MIYTTSQLKKKNFNIWFYEYSLVFFFFDEWGPS